MCCRVTRRVHRFFFAVVSFSFWVSFFKRCVHSDPVVNVCATDVVMIHVCVNFGGDSGANTKYT